MIPVQRRFEMLHKLKNRVSVAIVGAGILGSTLALFLSDKGFRVTLFEKRSHIGGLASSWTISGYQWDKFYHVILLSDTYLLSLLDRLGIRDKINWNYARSCFYVDAYTYPVSNAVEFLRFRPLSLMGRLRLAYTIFRASHVRYSEDLEKISAIEWIRRWGGEETHQKLWIPILKSKLGGLYDSASAVFVWASISRMYAARRSGLKKEMFGYVDGGYARILHALVDELTRQGVKIETGRTVGRVLQDNSDIILETSDHVKDKFNALVFTIPSPRIPRLCPQLNASEKKRLEDAKYVGLICASAVLRRSLGGYYYMYMIDNSMPFGSIVEMTALVDSNYFGGNTLVYLPRYTTDDDPRWNKDDESIQREFSNGLRRVFPFVKPQDILAFKVARARAAMPVQTLNYSRDILPSLSTSIRNVFVVNSSQVLGGTWNVNEMVSLAGKKAIELELVLKKGCRGSK